MSNQNNQYNQFKNNKIGTQPRGFGGNKGKKMQDKSGHQPQVIQTKGE
ncbi:acid-soluble spore protein N [Cytobacillus suaedae]|uniref:Small, acid-soluble spore protein N n=1 Tax=Litchfieldia luteola TaxID=682179 RepID=A0ABR9QJC7_9BACI|nr:acid-soluble spore protein N [Cytobacillus luteolus]MBE4908606.1 acid-soluble spore protein N [Cytobacillus luteolus]MBP1941461.1 small acid-soluble spore protein N (minor) [Cytobacillus luteolus]QOR68676.1 acid-soluble spore protein N [Cytobacillus suaedae]